MGQTAKVIQLRPDADETARDYARAHGLERNGGKPNPVWDACEVVLGYGPLTESEVKVWGRMTTSLRRAGATIDRIEAVASWYRRTWPNVDLTITAIEKWYSHFLAMEEKKNRKRSNRHAVCPECEVGGGRHIADCPNAKA